VPFAGFSEWVGWNLFLNFFYAYCHFALTLDNKWEKEKLDTINTDFIGLNHQIDKKKKENLEKIVQRTVSNEN